jgi:hypothetical protein
MGEMTVGASTRMAGERAFPTSAIYVVGPLTAGIGPPRNLMLWLAGETRVAGRVKSQR